MAGFYYEMERIIGLVSDNALEVALHYYGQELGLFRPQKSDVYSRVHSKDANGGFTQLCDFVGILQSDDFSPTDGRFSADFEEGFLYTKHKDILVGDVVTVKVMGADERRFKVEVKEHIGYSTSMFIKFRLSNMN